MKKIREAIENDNLTAFRKEFLTKYRMHKAVVHDEISRQESNNEHTTGYAGRSKTGPKD